MYHEGKLGVLIIISVFIATCFLLEVPKTCEADVITHTYINADGTFQNGTFLMMPEANVQIDIIRNNSGCFVLITGLFTIQTNVTQNCTLAFVFPGYSYSRSIWDDMSISINGTICDYVVLDLEQLGWNLDNSTCENRYQDWYTDSYYAVFRTTIRANETILIEVTSSGEIDEGAHYCSLEYIVGSARTFYGDTHQTITINITEYKPFLGRQFYPESYLTVRTHNIVTVATWDFQISEFESDVVATTLQFREHTPWTVPIPTTTPTTTNIEIPDGSPIEITIGVIAFATIGMIAIIVMYSKKR